jgi:hypothetical protein
VSRGGLGTGPARFSRFNAGAEAMIQKQSGPDNKKMYIWSDSERIKSRGAKSSIFEIIGEKDIGNGFKNHANIVRVGGARFVVVDETSIFLALVGVAEKVWVEHILQDSIDKKKTKKPEFVLDKLDRLVVVLGALIFGKADREGHAENLLGQQILFVQKQNNIGG